MASCSHCLLFLLSYLGMWTCHAAKDALRLGDNLDSSSSLVSATGKFTLAFWVPDPKSNFSYLTVRWDDSRNHAWIANPVTPVLYPLGVLVLDKNRTLKIIQKGKDHIELFTAPKATSDNVVATLLDSGNFILQELNSDGSTKQVLWQSFDHPSDTLLPGVKLGVNRKYDHIVSLSSWSSMYNASPGAFTLDWDPNVHELKIKRHGILYWTSGIFRNGIFKFMLPEKSEQRRYNLSIVSNENEDYFSYTTSDQSYKPEWVLSIAGKLFDFRSGVDIARADYCDGFETAGGCQKREQPGCRHFGDIYELKNGYFHATTSNLTVKTDPNISHSISDCKAACWEDCDCLGFIYLHEDQTGCQYWRKGWEFIPQDVLGYSTTSSIFVLVPKEFSDGDKNEADTKKWIWIGCVIVGAVLAMLICILCYIRRRKNSIISGESSTKIENEFLDLMNSNRSTDVNGIQNDGNTGHHDLRVFSYASIMVATDNFSKERKLGEGGFGPVYKGILATAREVAVKRLSRCSGQGALEFKNELVLISELQHRNLVQLLGFCIHEEERMLIYEYMPHKSLDCYLFDSSSGFLLDWKKRYNIIEGISQGLLYLHKYSRLRVIHRDLKASNILLDENMNPKISDFGMARIFTHNEMEANTNRVVGTYGYMSPEYAMEGIFSTKSDVYSFGVLMLEIISGRRNNSFYNDHHVLNLIGYVWLLWKEGTAVRLMDPALGDSCNEDQLVRCIHVGLLCVEENADDRPTMSDVISMLTNESTPLQSPTKPAFFKGRTMPAGEGLQQISVNDLSISIVDAR